MATATYEDLLGQLQAEAAAAQAAAQAAQNELETAAALLQAKREAEHVADRDADRAAAAAAAKAAELAAMRHRVSMLGYALKVCDGLALVGAEIEAAERDARAARLATHNGPLGLLRELKPKMASIASKRAIWAAQRVELARRIAEAERAH